MVPSLPVPVLDFPRWRFNIRPATYEPARIRSLGDCEELMHKSRVRLRGWSFPHIPRTANPVESGDRWISSSSAAFGHFEYWRFYQSGQFLYLGSIREVTEPDWNARIRKDMKTHADDDVDVDSVPGFVSWTEVVYTTTEYFEFAARLAQSGIYDEPLTLQISLNEVQGFMLAADFSRAWSSDYVARLDRIVHEVTLDPSDVIAKSAEEAMRATLAIVERFGWRRPNVDAIKTEQQKIITGKW